MACTNYSIVSYLLGEDFKVVRELQKEISKVTGSQKCLIDWLPHITVGDGIIVENESLAEIEGKLSLFASEQKIITATMSGFGGTETWKGASEGKVTPYVIWLDVVVSDDLSALFNRLRDDVTSKQETWLPRTVNYVPHVTIAFFDLSKEGYEKGLAYLDGKIIEREFVIDHIALVECYGEGGLTSTEYKKFYFQK